MYTKEALLAASTFGKQTGCKGVLTSEESFARAISLERRQGTLIVISNMEEGLFFFSDDHCFGVDVLPENWVHCTVTFPLSVKARAGLEDGIVDTIEKYIFVFQRDDRQICCIDELINVLNKGETKL